MSETLKLINMMCEELAEIRSQADEIAKLKALNGELTSALRLICAADNMTEAKIAVIQANTLLQSEAAK